MNTFLDQNLKKDMSAYFDMKPNEPLGAGAGMQMCNPYQLVKDQEFWVDAIMAAKAKDSIVYFHALRNDSLRIDSTEFAMDAQTAIFLSGVMATSQSDESRVTIIQEYFKRLGWPKSRDEVGDLMSLLTVAKFRGIHHLAFRGIVEGVTRNSMLSFAKLFNIKTISYPSSPTYVITPTTNLLRAYPKTPAAR